MSWGEVLSLRLIFSLALGSWRNIILQSHHFSVLRCLFPLRPRNHPPLLVLLFRYRVRVLHLALPAALLPAALRTATLLPTTPPLLAVLRRWPRPLRRRLLLKSPTQRWHPLRLLRPWYLGKGWGWRYGMLRREDAHDQDACIAKGFYNLDSVGNVLPMFHFQKSMDGAPEYIKSWGGVLSLCLSFPLAVGSCPRKQVIFHSHHSVSFPGIYFVHIWQIRTRQPYCSPQLSARQPCSRKLHSPQLSAQQLCPRQLSPRHLCFRQLCICSRQFSALSAHDSFFNIAGSARIRIPCTARTRR